MYLTKNLHNLTIPKSKVAIDYFTVIFSWVKKLLNNLLDFIWPQFCLSCGREGSLCCGFCLNDILLEDAKTIIWPDNKQKYFDTCYNCCDYQDKLVQKLIKYYKYNYLENLANLLTDILERQARRLNIDKNTIIVNAPLHKKKQKQRGFDQTELLAKKLAERLSLDYSPLLLRTKNNPAQAKLNKKARQKNVADIFSINPSALLRVSNKKIALNTLPAGSLPQSFSEASRQERTNILLIDDVTTTGSTLNQAAKILRENNFGKIICLVLAKNKNS